MCLQKQSEQNKIQHKKSLIQKWGDRAIRLIDREKNNKRIYLFQILFELYFKNTLVPMWMG